VTLGLGSAFHGNVYLPPILNVLKVVQEELRCALLIKTSL